MNPYLAAMDLVSVSGDNAVSFNPGQLVLQVLNAASAAVAVGVAIVAMWIVMGWMFRLLRMGSGWEESYDYKDDNPWHAGDGGIYMPAEYAGAIAYGATVIPGEREVTVHALTDGEAHEVTMSRGDYERWQGLVDHEEAQGSERF